MKNPITTSSYSGEALTMESLQKAVDMMKKVPVPYLIKINNFDILKNRVSKVDGYIARELGYLYGIKVMTSNRIAPNKYRVYYTNRSPKTYEWA